MINTVRQRALPLCRLVCLASFFGACLATGQTGSKQLRLETTEVSLGKIPSRIVVESVTVSPDGNHVAFASVRNDKFVVVVDGVAGKECDGWGEESGLLFSQDSKHIAYARVRGGRISVVEDDVEGEQYDAVGAPRHTGVSLADMEKTLETIVVCCQMVVDLHCARIDILRS